MPREVYTLQYEASMQVHEEVFCNPSERPQTNALDRAATGADNSQS